MLTVVAVGFAFFCWGHSQSYHPFGCPSLPFLLLFHGPGVGRSGCFRTGSTPHSTHCVDTACGGYLRHVPSACAFFKASFFFFHQVNLGSCVRWLVALAWVVGGRFVAVVRGFLTM